MIQRTLTLLVALLLAPQAILHAADSSKPNIVVIMVDDLGWKDLHCYGNPKLDTPALDQLATEGMRFTNGYAAAPVCTPTRAAMMTGQSPARLWITNHAPGNPDGFSLKGSDLQEAENRRHLPLAAVTIAERLSAAGYATAHVGKWHLSHMVPNQQGGVTEKDLRPDKQGFALNIGGYSGGGPPSYFSPYRIPTLADGKEGEYLPDRLADEAIAFIREHKSGPFFLNWWPYSVHYPLQAREAVIAKYRQRGGLKDPIYAAMIEDMDTAIGRFLKALDEAGLREKTLVVFKSDNGGYNGDNRPLRGLKGMLYEGGIRVPWIVRWPGKVQPGTTNATPVISTDCYPTLLEAAGLPPTPNHLLDGKSLLPLLTQSPGFVRDALYFHYPNYAFHRENRLGSAIREGQYKLIRNDDDGSLELYDLRSDIGEENNLASQSPEIVKRLVNKLDTWLQETGARMPVKKTAITRIAFLGDSITTGVGVKIPAKERYATVTTCLLASKYSSITEINLGQSGRSLCQQNADYSASVLKQNPDALVIQWGVNDHYWGFSVAEFVARYDALVAALRTAKPQLPIVVMTLIADFRWAENQDAWIGEANIALQEIAVRYRCHLADTHRALDHQKTFYADSIHPNTAGAEVMAKTIVAALEAPPLSPDKSGVVVDNLTSNVSFPKMQSFTFDPKGHIGPFRIEIKQVGDQLWK